MFSFHVKGRKQPQWPSPQQSRPARARSTVTEPAHEYGSWQPTVPSQQWLLRPLQAVLSRPGPASDWSTTRSAPTGPEGGHDPATLSATTPGLKASVRPWRPRHRGRRWPDRSFCAGDEEPHGGLGEDAAGVGNQFCGVARRKISPKRLAMEAHRRRREARSLNLVDGRGVQSLVA
jgi:hypothetical protein